ncbi:hypothetical protein Barb6_03770 [Bacteroidales bacterium Barb6]|nr:hypothetical protein Barb6_03770 [Bacteroidales bacterium Barb6]
MVVAFSPYQLLERVTDMLANGNRLPQIHRTALYRRKLTRRNEIFINGSVCIGVDINKVIQNVSTRLAGKVEIAVIGEIDNRRLVGSRFIRDA